MNKVIRTFFIVAVVAIFGYTLFYLFNKSQKKPYSFHTEAPYVATIIKKTVATGSINPREDVEIKPQVSGIIEELFVEPGDQVKAGDLLARIRIVPNMAALNQAENRLAIAKNTMATNKAEFDRNKSLFNQGVIPEREFQQIELQYKNAQTELEAAKENLEIVREGASKKAGKTSITLVKATVSGMVLDVPVRKGNQVIESNQFNDGTTVAVIANMNDMIFEGLIDESEVGKIKEGMDLLVSIGAIENETFPAQLEYIAPKGSEANGAIQFEIRAQMLLAESGYFIRAGYSANADIVLAKREDVLTIKESLVQYENGKPFVEVFVKEGEFKMVPVKLGLSDGIQVEVLGGINGKEEIKVWNKPIG
ncbi:MAG: efflux RND transporter periplasmic adaptor subunit [Schleiferiaceae bacterium]|nr:efflux RND transporter periplasmic adaptor subunit [Schleiferiaceae bacterium]